MIFHNNPELVILLIHDFIFSLLSIYLSQASSAATLHVGMNVQLASLARKLASDHEFAKLMREVMVMKGCFTAFIHEGRNMKGKGVLLDHRST